MKTISIKGVSKYYDLEGGFWGIETTSGKKFLPIIFPEQLKVDGAEIFCSLKVMDDVTTMQMWGTPVKITSFHTLAFQ